MKVPRYFSTPRTGNNTSCSCIELVIMHRLNVLAGQLAKLNALWNALQIRVGCSLSQLIWLLGKMLDQEVWIDWMSLLEVWSLKLVLTMPAMVEHCLITCLAD